MLPLRESFHPEFRYIQTAWDSTSLTAWMTCPTYYLYSIVYGYRTSEAGLHFKFGEIVHAGMEIYNKARFHYLPHDEAQIDALQHILLKYRDWKTESTQKNLWNAIRSVIWRSELMNEQPNSHALSIGGVPAVELPFKYDLGIEFDGNQILYCGHIDKAEEDAVGSVWVIDYKTTKSQVGTAYFAGYKPSTQLPGYAIAAKIVLHLPIAGVKVDAIQVGVNFSRCATGHLMSTPAEEGEWVRDARWYIGLATSVMKNSKGDPALVPRNTESCFGCAFRGVCAHPPSIRQAILDAAFEQKFWDPIARKEAV